MTNKSVYQAVSSTTMDESIISYPGQHDIVVVASDGVRFNLSRTVLATTSGFFADMFTVGEASSSTQSPSEGIVNVAEDHVVLDSLFAISYSHPKKPKPNIATFAQIVKLIRVAKKYSMHHALDYLSYHLMLPRSNGTTVIQPFTVTHPLPTLSLSLIYHFDLPARLALNEVVNAPDSIWSTTSGDAELDSVPFNLQTLKKIHGMRNSRAKAYKGFINGTLSSPPYEGLIGKHCAGCVSKWKVALLKRFEEAPNSAAFSVAFYKEWTCSKCGYLVVVHNSISFKGFIAQRIKEERTLPELR